MKHRNHFAAALAMICTAGLLSVGQVEAQNVFDGNIIYNNGGAGDTLSVGVVPGVLRPGGPSCARGFLDPAAGGMFQLNDFDLNTIGSLEAAEGTILSGHVWPGTNYVPLNSSIASGWNDDVSGIAYTASDSCDTCSAERRFEEVCYRGAVPPSDIGADWTAGGWLCLSLDSTCYGALKPIAAIRQGVQATQTWSSDSTYVLRGKVSFPDGTVLTIEPGTVVLGENATQGYLVIARGAKIFANGTAADPIILTTDALDPTTGAWGGLVLNGRAQANFADCSIDSIASEGGDGGFYCGTDDCDSSGVLRYVRVHYSGVTFVTDNELNSFTFNGVGSRTIAEYLQATRGRDDSFEWFGGKMNARYLHALGQIDDGVDWQGGFRGTVQNAIVQFVSSINGDKGIEADNNENDFNAPCRSNPIIANCSFIGPGRNSAAGSTHGIHLRRGTNAHIYNTIVTEFEDHGFRVQSTELCNNGFGAEPGPGGCDSYVGVDGTEDVRPTIATGVRTFPNPMASETSFSFNIPNNGKASLRVYDMRGRLVDQVFDRAFFAGSHQVSWAPKSDLSSGVYFYRLEKSDGPVSGRFTILR